MNALIGIDLGTSNVKVLLCDDIGNTIASASGGYKTYHRVANGAEQSGDAWWVATVSSIREVMKHFDPSKDHVAGIMTSGQGPSLLPLNAEGRPMRDAMIWMDRRADAQIQQIVDYFGLESYKNTFGVNPDCFYLAPKLLWLKQKEPEIFDYMHVVHTTNSYINYKLTGEHAIDTAQAYLLYSAADLKTGGWSKKLSELLGRDLDSFMPPLKSFNDFLGKVTKEASLETGIPEGTSVYVGTTDGLSAPLEAGITDLSIAADITGTSSLIYFGVDRPVPKNVNLMCILQPFDLPKVPYLIAAPVNSAGASLKWYSSVYYEQLMAVAKSEGHDNPFRAIDSMAERSPAGANKLMYFPYLSGERSPLWNSHVKGMFIGMTSSTSQEDFCRALLEGTAFSVRENAEAARACGAKFDRFRVTGGGANSDIWLKIKASVLHCPIYASRNTGGAALGDAVLAGYGAGLYESFAKGLEMYQHISCVVEPDPEWEKRYDELFPVFIRMRNKLLEDHAALDLLSF